MTATTERQFMNGIMYRRVTVWLPEQDVLRYKRLGGISIHLRKAVKEHSAFLDVLCRQYPKIEDLQRIVMGWV
jgi:hypothetical protein